jgi:thymidylate synthase (FAD)
MSEIQILEDVEVKFIRGTGGDESVVQAARVSVEGQNAPVNAESDEGLIRYLIDKKHGSPFEHNSLTFYVQAPIFAFREFQRHRIGFSYNEMSGRYMELPNEFYAPAADRPLINIGTSARPQMAPADQNTVQEVRGVLIDAYESAWGYYQDLLGLGIAKEVARLVLPVGIMSQMYVTTNARAVMNFLALRTHRPDAAHVSHPQREIEMVAEKIEAVFAERFPITHKYFDKFGRVSP